MRRIAALAFILVLLCCAPVHAGDADPLHQEEFRKPPLYVLPQFKLIDQNGNVVQREQLLGKVCVVSVFFSCCTTACPITQKAMADLRDKLAAWPDVLLVSVNVYPGHDTQTIVADYARDRHADPARWLFLSGDKEEIYKFVQKGLLQGLAENTAAEPGREVDHTPNFLIIDHRGVIRGYVDGRNPDEVEQLSQFVKRLVQAKYLPSVNAGLNATCGVLLVTGFVLIRSRKILAHKVFMLAALAVSAVFLGCYLYYHFIVLDGKPTRFEGEGAVYATYMAILLSHTLLAAVVAPLALRVTYLGLRNRLGRHVALARWTLPVWLYVCVTGVVVYWMLYHLYPPVG